MTNIERRWLNPDDGQLYDKDPSDGFDYEAVLVVPVDALPGVLPRDIGRQAEVWGQAFDLHPEHPDGDIRLHEQRALTHLALFHFVSEGQRMANDRRARVADIIHANFGRTAEEIAQALIEAGEVL